MVTSMTSRTLVSVGRGRRHSRRSGAGGAEGNGGGAKGEGGGAGLWRLLLTLQQQPPQTGATPLPFGATGA